MVVLGFDEPAWVTVVREKGPELAVAVMAEVPGVRQLVVTPDLAAGRVIASGVPAHHDRYTTAWNVTEALTELWGGLVDETVSLRVVVGSLQTDVPGRYFAEKRYTRNRWATLSFTMLVHTAVHDDSPYGLFDDQHSRDPR